MTHRSRTILLVEDDADTLRLYALTFQQAGYVTVCAASVSVALDVLRAKHVDVVLTDHALGDGTGTELLEQARSEKLLGARTLVVMCTADDRVVPPPGVALLHKPIRPSELCRTVAQRLDDFVEQLA